MMYRLNADRSKLRPNASTREWRLTHLLGALRLQAPFRPLPEENFRRRRQKSTAFSCQVINKSDTHDVLNKRRLSQIGNLHGHDVAPWCSRCIWLNAEFQKDVLRVEIAVHNGKRMLVVKSRSNVLNDERGLMFLQMLRRKFLHSSVAIHVHEFGDYYHTVR